MREDLAAFGVDLTDADLAAFADDEPTEPEQFEVEPENWPAVLVFNAMGTQWRRAGQTGAATGLDYTPLPFVMRMHGVSAADRSACFAAVRLMEHEALAIYADQAKKG